MDEVQEDAIVARRLVRWILACCYGGRDFSLFAIFREAKKSRRGGEIDQQ